MQGQCGIVPALLLEVISLHNPWDWCTRTRQSLRLRLPSSRSEHLPDGVNLDGDT